MTSSKHHAEIVAHLTEQGYTAPQIIKIMEKVAEYDRRIVRDSVLDAIAEGSFNLDSIIREALNDDEAS
ncbi:MAG: hypothetical protein K1X74_02360 [Pirellulales bacterium]|nr:hypothetical protein [Pirellulales bacterium]